MVLINQKWDKILESIFEYPNREFTIREISKITKIPTSNIQRYLKELREKEIINTNNQLIINNYNKFLKSYFMINKLYENKLIDYINNTFVPSLIIIFGSVRKGEYDFESDIDIFIESTKNIKVDLSNFEKKLNHKIQLFIYKDIKELPNNLLNNVINGIKLTGYIKIK